MRVLANTTALLTMLGFAGCTGETSAPSDRVLATIREVGGLHLRGDAEEVAARVTTRDLPGPTKIPEALWTESIRRFKPKHVFWGGDHLTIVTHESGRLSNGLRVYFASHPDDALSLGEFAGGGSGGEVYKVEAGIYWFWQKRRSDGALRLKIQEAEQEPDEQTNSAAAPYPRSPSLFSTCCQPCLRGRVWSMAQTPSVQLLHSALGFRPWFGHRISAIGSSPTRP
jgi:hypothetical protein